MVEASIRQAARAPGAAAAETAAVCGAAVWEEEAQGARARARAQGAVAEGAERVGPTVAGTMAASRAAAGNILRAEQVLGEVAKGREGGRAAPVHVGAAAVAASTHADQ